MCLGHIMQFQNIQAKKIENLFMLFMISRLIQLEKNLKNRKKGNNQNEFWKSKVSVMSSKRKKIFFQNKILCKK